MAAQTMRQDGASRSVICALRARTRVAHDHDLDHDHDPDLDLDHDLDPDHDPDHFDLLIVFIWLLIGEGPQLP